VVTALDLTNAFNMVNNDMLLGDIAVFPFQLH